MEIRKLRKKIRQIECLEHLDRDLTEDEVLKVLRCNHMRGCSVVVILSIRLAVLL